jgi:hypothetical protein
MATPQKKPSVSDQVEYNLRQQADAGVPPLTRSIIPEVEAEVNAWIEKNPEKYKLILSQGLETLARREALRTSRREAIVDKEAELILAKLKENPTLSARVEDRIRNVPEERKARARVSVAKDLIARDVVSQHQTA